MPVQRWIWKIAFRNQRLCGRRTNWAANVIGSFATNEFTLLLREWGQMQVKKLMALAGLMAVSGPLLAHHSAAAEYVSELSTWKGVITSFSWMNPHTWVYFDVKDANGKVIKYECEGSAPSGLIGNGWTRTTLKPGDQVTIQGYRAKDRPEGCKVRNVILQDGKQMTMGWIEGGAGAGKR